MSKIIDLHNDFLVEIKNDKKKIAYLENSNMQNVSGIFSAVWTSDLSSYYAMKRVEASSNFVKTFNSNHEDKKLYLAIEDLHFYSKNNLDKIINIAPAYCSLSWNSDNCLAGGAIEGGDLTTLGIEVVKSLEDNHIQIDTAHLSERSFMTFSMLTQRPLFCSHTAVASLQSHRRNLKDYQIKMVVESGGLVGIAFVSDFICQNKQSTVGDVARHIDYVVSRFGDDYVSLGTDYFGTKNLPRSLKDYKSLNLLEDRLKTLGHTQETIDKIFYKNAQSFFNI
ncbi:MAG: membrane dipeptidase [Clostridia bacterium]|nr:membrane dipeptidase [Clostridia bacterium]